MESDGWEWWKLGGYQEVFEKADGRAPLTVTSTSCSP